MHDREYLSGTRRLTIVSMQAYGGMRDVKSMVYETSLLDAQEVSSIDCFTLRMFY